MARLTPVFIVLLLLANSGCTLGSKVDADVFYSVCYFADPTYTAADKCAEPGDIHWDFDDDGELLGDDGVFPNACDENGLDDQRLEVEYTYGIKVLGDAGEVRVYSDDAVLGDGVLVGTRVSYESPVFTSEYEDGEVTWFISGELQWYDGQAEGENCPGLDAVAVPSADYAEACLWGEEALIVLNSTHDGIPAGSSRSSCRQEFQFSGDKVEQ